MTRRIRPAMVGILLGMVCVSSGAAEAVGVPADAVRRVYADVSPAVGLVEYTAEVVNASTGDMTRRSGNCLGLVVSRDGLVMAFGHLVLENSEPVHLRVRLGQGTGNEQVYPGEILAKPEDVNVSFIQLQSDTPLNLPFVRFESSPLRLDDPIAIVGVLGSPLDNVPGVQQRRIGAVLDRPRTTYCIDERVAFGFVGGPVIDHGGRVVGVVGYDLSPEEGGELYVRSGHPLVYQASLFARYIKNPLEKDTEDAGEGDGWLGILSQPLTVDLAAYWNLPDDGGVVVSTVVPASPAAEAGMAVGDVLRWFNDNELDIRLDREIRGFTKLVRESPVGTPVAVKLLRDGKPMELQVTLRQQPKSRREAAEYENEVLGLKVREITTDMRLLLNLPESINGVIVRSIRSGSPAHVAGLRPGVIVLNFGNYPIASLADFEQATTMLAESKPAEISVLGLSPSGRQFYRIEPRW